MAFHFKTSPAKIFLLLKIICSRNRFSRLGDFAGKQTIVASWADPRATQHSWIPNARRYLNNINIQTIPWVTNAPDYFQGYGAKAIGAVCILSASAVR
jgi:hypothetical protein